MFENVNNDNTEEWRQSEASKLEFRHMKDTDIANAAMKQKGEEEGGKDGSEEGQSSDCTTYHGTTMC
jgi:hypothetical protein